MDIKVSKRKKPTIQLTSLLDLLFIMIFISLTQAQNIDSSPPQVSKPQEVQKSEEQVITITAIFHFYATSSNPKVPTGTYAMKGELNRSTGDLHLGGINWIQRPSGYDLVPLSGKLSSDQRTFTGRIEFPGCQQFTLQRTSNVDGSEVAGMWKGSYTCTQGETGLTLTIQ